MYGTFFFDPDDLIYEDHFPGHPVVPGSMIINAFMLAADKLSPSFRTRALENFRFRRFIPPGEYAYRIEVVGDDEVKCTLYDNQSAVANGTLKG